MSRKFIYKYLQQWWYLSQFYINNIFVSIDSIKRLYIIVMILRNHDGRIHDLTGSVAGHKCL